MYLSARQIKTLGSVMQTLAQPYEEAEIRVVLARLMLDLLGAQFCASFVWQPQQQCFDAPVSLHMDPVNVLQYERYYQFHDPITHALQAHRKAVRVSDVMPQADLVRTEFFNDFLARDGLYWGVNLYAWAGQNNIGDLRIWRDSRRENFSDADLQLLDLVRPAFVAALLRARADPSLPESRQQADFVAEKLSKRELQIAQLAATGSTDKEIARQLGISLSTVRTHLGHVFDKLQVSKRVKLAQCLLKFGTLQ